MRDERFTALLFYPDAKEAALGSPGFREVFRALSADAEVLVDWAWYDDKQEEIVYECRQWRGPYDIVGFSVPYELLYANAVKGLAALGIEPEREKRGGSRPIVIAGGAAATLNQAVCGAIADVVYIGEAEPGVAETLKQAVQAGKTGAAPKLTPMSGRKLPGTVKAAPRFISAVSNIESRYMDGFDEPSACAFPDAGLVEVGRGCSRGCRFCAAGHIYLPVRHRTVDDVLRDARSFTGKAKRIGLVGASVSDHRHLREIMRGIIGMGFGLTTSSFRADMLDIELASLLVQGGLKTVTIAPEAGTERMRRIVKKHLGEQDITAAAEACAKAGIPSLRLYYMVGLPWERSSDIEGIVTLTQRIRDTYSASGGRITVSVNPFIPKPQTPFQWCAMADERYLNGVYGTLERSFRAMKGVTLKTLSIRVAVREAVISLGGEPVGHAVIANARDNIPWKKALSDNDVDVDRLIQREKEADEHFPWDTVCGGTTKAALRASYEKARNAALDS